MREPRSTPTRLQAGQLSARWGSRATTRGILVAAALVAVGCRPSPPPVNGPATQPPSHPPVSPPVKGRVKVTVASTPLLWKSAELDAALQASWLAAGIVPAGPADDFELLRRVFLDVVGRVPTLSEVDGYFAPPAATRRERLVDALLASPEMAEHWSDLYVDLFVDGQFRRPKIEKHLDPRGYFARVFSTNRPFDQVARELLTFSGELEPGGPGVFVASHLKGTGPEALASVTARLFLGLQIRCAQCHDHPSDARYKQTDFQSFAAYFARTRFHQQRVARDDSSNLVSTDTPSTAEAMPAPPPPGPAESADKDRDNSVYEVTNRPGGRFKLRRPGTDEDFFVEPRFLGRQIVPLGDEQPRETLARAILASDLFAKTIVDRTWTQLFGRGLVEPWDDLGGEHDAQHPPLLSSLADDFRASGYDFRHLLRLILLSRAYGLSSRGPGDATARFGQAAVRRLTPEQTFTSLLTATGAAHFDRAAPEALERKTERALREFVFTFGDDEAAEVNILSTNVPQALLLMNGDITNQGARSKDGGTLAAILSQSRDPGERVRRLFLATYCRPPTAAETERSLAMVGGARPPQPALEREARASAPDRASERRPYEDLFFALLTSSEMLTNH